MEKDYLDDYLREKIEEILKDEKEFLSPKEYEETFNYELKKLKEKDNMSLDEYKNVFQDALFNHLSDKNKTLRKTDKKIKIKK